MNHSKLISILVGILALGFATSAFAQDDLDPFAAYEGQKVEKPTPPPPPPAPEPPPPAPLVVIEPPPTPPPPPPAPEPPPEEPGIDKFLKPNRFSLNANIGFAFDHVANEVLNGSSSGNTAFFARLGLGLGYNIIERLTLEFTANTIWRRNARQLGTFVTEHDWAFELHGLYSLPVAKRTSLLGGVGMGAYFGNSVQNIKLGSTNLSENTSAIGFISNLNAGIAYLIIDGLSLRMLLDLTWMIGNENIASQNKNLSSNMAHIGLGIGMNYTF